MTKKKSGLTWKDYVAIIIAMFTTTLLPFIIFLLVFLAIVAIITLM